MECHKVILFSRKKKIFKSFIPIWLRDHEGHLKRIDEITKFRKPNLNDPLLVEHIKHMHQSKELSRKMIRTGNILNYLLCILIFWTIIKNKNREKFRNKSKQSTAFW